VQVFDWSTTVKKVVVIAENTMLNQKQCLMYDRRRPWRTLRDNDVNDAQNLRWRRDPAQYLRGAWGRRDNSCMFCTPYLAAFPTHFSQLDLNPANLEDTIEAEWILAFLFLRKRHFSMTSQWRHHSVVSWKYWWDILQFLSHTDCQDDSCQKLWKVV